MKAFYVFIICLISCQSIKTDRRDMLSTSFDVKEVMNFTGTANLTTHDAKVIKIVELVNEGVMVDGISVTKNNGIYSSSGSSQPSFAFNHSLSQIINTSESDELYRKNQRAKNGVFWESKTSEGIFAQTTIGKGKVNILIENNSNDEFLAMVLMERIHHARSLLIAQNAFF